MKKSNRMVARQLSSVSELTLDEMGQVSGAAKTDNGQQCDWVNTNTSYTKKIYSDIGDLRGVDRIVMGSDSD